MYGSCETCDFWRRVPETKNPPIHVCRRKAPVPLSTGEPIIGNFEVYWPPTLADDGCGEWRPKGDKGFS